jgi:hypothetical protein
LYEFDDVPEVNLLKPVHMNMLKEDLVKIVKNPHKTGILPFTINAQSTEAILTFCERHDFHLSHLLAAISAKTNAELLSNSQNINCHFPVDLRENKRKGARALAYQTSWVEFLVAKVTVSSLLELTDIIKNQLKTALNEREFITNLQHLHDEIETLAPETVIANNQRMQPTIVITGIEHMNMFSSMPVDNVFMAVNCQAYIANGQSFMLIYNIVNNKLDMNLLYVKTLNSEQQMLSIQKNIYEALLALSFS